MSFIGLLACIGFDARPVTRLSGASLGELRWTLIVLGGLWILGYWLLRRLDRAAAAGPDSQS